MIVPKILCHLLKSIVFFQISHVNGLHPGKDLRLVYRIPKFEEHIQKTHQTGQANSTPSPSFTLQMDWILEAEADRLITDLKSCVDDTDFNAVTFSWQRPRFEKALLSLRHSVTVSDNRGVFEKKLDFASHMFLTMREIADWADSHSILGFTYGSLLIKVMKVNARIFSLYDSNGKPDPSIHNYKLKVTNLLSVLDQCDSKSVFFDNATAEVKRKFYFELFRARVRLHAIQSL